jgi:DNA processing protein
MSGLAAGVDTEAHSATIQCGGRTVAVIGTPLDVAYPAANARLQEKIYREHLLVSPFPIGSRVFRSNFPERNKVMAALSDATVIMEASDTSGSLHQAAECRPDRLDRWLFISQSVVNDPRLTWPKKFLGGPKVKILRETSDVLAVLG